jgi:glutamate-1-semialdehyde 2,1-aminomutase
MTLSTNSRYKKSNMLLEKALKIIPSGAQSSSKSIKQYPYGISPYFVDRAMGCRTWDVDGNEYVDFISALLSVNLGYQDSNVDEAVKRQMSKGVIFSLSHTIELELAEKIIEMIPCAEMVKFGKNGSDVTSASVRLARAYTKRDHIICCGYHGWSDWYAGSVNKYQLGVPEVCKKLVHSFEYNNIESLENLFLNLPSQVAAVIMEPMHSEFPKSNFLNMVKNISSSNGAMLIFDEIVTGF